MTTTAPPAIAEIKNARQQLGHLVRTTPVIKWESIQKDKLLGPETEVIVKLELFQYAGSFKPRGALLVMKNLSEGELARGVTAVSAGNHAMAVGYAARVMKTSAKVVMPASANPGRIKACRNMGVEVVLVNDVSKAFDKVRQIQEEEGRTFVHPFEGPLTALGTATVGLELVEQAGELDAVIIPVGGGGLAAGIASAIGQIQPQCRIFGVEPEGADTMYRSFQSGKTESLTAVRTIADSLGAPFSMPYSLSLCRQFIERMVLITDDMIKNTMALMATELKLAVEPAGAASLSALLGPLREELRGKRVGIICCGANTDIESFCQHISAARGWS